MLVICTYTSYSQSVPNGSFERWELNHSGMPEPVGWKTQNDREMTFVESSEGYTGSFSACLNVVWDRMKQEYTGGTLTTASRFTIEEKFFQLSGFFSGSSGNNDTLVINVNLYCEELQIAFGTESMTAVESDWQPFEIEIAYLDNRIPDRADISISIIPAKGYHHQTVYCLDDLKLK